VADGVSPSWPLSLTLGFVAGFVDSMGFIALGLFPAHITGNFVLIGDIVASTHSESLLRLIAFFAFVAAVAFARLCAHWREESGPPLLRPMLFLELLFVAGFALFAEIAGSARSSNLIWGCLAAAMSACAMGVQSASLHLIFSEPTSTTAMTGNVTKLVLNGMDLLLHGGQGLQRRRTANLALLVFGFAFGAFAGASGIRIVGIAALMLPIVVLVITAVMEWTYWFEE